MTQEALYDLWGEKASKRVIGDTLLHLGRDDEGEQEGDLGAADKALEDEIVDDGEAPLKILLLRLLLLLLLLLQLQPGVA